jgi:hypothetical protein
MKKEGAEGESQTISGEREKEKWKDEMKSEEY